MTGGTANSAPTIAIMTTGIPTIVRHGAPRLVASAT